MLTLTRPTRLTLRRSAYVVLAAAALSVAGAAAACGPAVTDTKPSHNTQLVASAGEAATATVTPNASPQSAVGPPQTAKLPTPKSESDTMWLGGSVWVNARLASGDVVAYIAGKECGRAKTMTLPDSYGPEFLITIASDRDQPGCGTPGAEISMTINDLALNDRVIWQPGMRQPLDLVVGPAFARYYGEFRFNRSLMPLRVVPYIDGEVCGAQMNPFQGDGQVGYDVVVQPEELRSGCGREGVDVTFIVQFKDQPDFVLDVVPWQTGPMVKRPLVDLTGRIPVAAQVPSPPAQ